MNEESPAFRRGSVNTPQAPPAKRAAEHACVDCRALPERPADEALLGPGIEYRPASPRSTPHGSTRKTRRCAEHWLKPCVHCGESLPDRRRNYHPECIGPARERAKFAERRCARCRRTRAASSFSSDPTRPDGKFPWCKDCQNEATIGRSHQSPMSKLNGHTCPLCDTAIRGNANRRFCSNSCRDKAAALRRKYNLSVEQYRTLVDATGGRCPLCDCRPKMWAVDHDHRTGLVTGVVCTGCNVQLLAASRHDIARVERLLGYLQSTPAAQLGIIAHAPEGAHRPSKIHKMWRHAS